MKNNKRYKIIWSPTFQKELKNIYNYLFYHLKNPIVAKKLYNKIIQEIYSLEYFPERCVKLITSNNINLRKLLINNYVIIYEVDNDIRTSFYSTYISW